MPAPQLVEGVWEGTWRATTGFPSGTIKLQLNGAPVGSTYDLTGSAEIAGGGCQATWVVKCWSSMPSPFGATTDISMLAEQGIPRALATVRFYADFLDPDTLSGTMDGCTAVGAPFKLERVITSPTTIAPETVETITTEQREGRTVTTRTVQAAGTD